MSRLSFIYLVLSVGVLHSVFCLSFGCCCCFVLGSWGCWGLGPFEGGISPGLLNAAKPCPPKNIGPK